MSVSHQNQQPTSNLGFEELTSSPRIQSPTFNPRGRQPTSHSSDNQPTSNPSDHQSTSNSRNEQPTFNSSDHQSSFNPGGQQPASNSTYQQPISDPRGQQPISDSSDNQPTSNPNDQQSTSDHRNEQLTSNFSDHQSSFNSRNQQPTSNPSDQQSTADHRGQQDEGAGPLSLPPSEAPEAGRSGAALDEEPSNTSTEHALSMALQGMCGASLCAILLLALLLSSLPLAFFAAWLVSPPSINRTYPLVFDYRLPNPSVTVPLFPPKPPLLWWPRKSETKQNKQNKPTKQTLLQGQRFDASLILSLPESEHNMNLGIFQVSAAAFSPSGEILASSSLPCMARFSSLPKRIVRATLLAVPILLGLVREVQVINLPLLQGNVGPTPLHTIKLILHPSAASAGGGVAAASGLPQVSSAKLRLRTTWWGSSPWLALWPISSFAWLLCLLCFYEILGTCICCNLLLRPSIRSAQSWLQSRGADSVPHEMHPWLLPYHAVPVATPVASHGPAAALPPVPAVDVAEHQPADRTLDDHNTAHLGDAASTGLSGLLRGPEESSAGLGDSSGGLGDSSGGLGDSTGGGALSEPEEGEVEKITEVAENTLRNMPLMSKIDAAGVKEEPAERESAGEDGPTVSEASTSASEALTSRSEAQQRGLRFRGSRRVDDDEDESENDNEDGGLSRTGSLLLSGPGCSKFQEDESKES